MVAKKISFFDAINCSFGIVIVCIRLPLTINLISIEFEVNAITYGKAQTKTTNVLLQRKVDYKIKLARKIVGILVFSGSLHKIEFFNNESTELDI